MQREHKTFIIFIGTTDIEFERNWSEVRILLSGDKTPYYELINVGGALEIKRATSIHLVYTASLERKKLFLEIWLF